MRSAISSLLAAALLLAAAGCAQQGVIARAQARSESGDLEGAREELERERELRPRSADVRVALGETYYRIARFALDRERDEARYLAFLERSVSEFVTALEIDPRDARPHVFLAVMDVYRGDLQRALRGFANARRLAPVGIAYTNIAEVYVYRGQLERAQEWNDLGLKKGARYGAGLFNDMLIAWKQGDLDEARQCFADLRRADPEMLSTINMVRLAEPPGSFEDFAGYCCGSPACGPFMKEPCQALALDVREREISNEAVLQELRIEMEKQRRLQEIYEQRKELEIEIESGGDDGSRGGP
jgi:tetratricopeptide (TPR) repeat protein